VCLTLLTDFRSAMTTLVAVSLLISCGCKGSGEQPAPDGVEETATVIGVCQATLDDPWLVQMKADMQAAVEKHSDVALVFEDAAGNAGRQQQQVEKFIADGVAALVITPVASQDLTAPVAQAMEAGIPAVVLHRPLVGGDYTTLIRADNEQIGQAAGAWLAENLGGKGRVVELKGPVDDDASKERHEGFLATIRKRPEMRVLRDYPTRGKEAVAREQMNEALDTFEEIDAVYAHDDASAHGAHLAAEEAGRRGEMLIVGIGGLPDEGLAYVREGKLDAAFEVPTGGAKAIDLAVKALEGKEVPKNVRLESRVFTPENVDEGDEAIEAP